MADFKEPALHEGILRSSTDHHRDLCYFPNSTIAADNGVAAGSGFDLAGICDLPIGLGEAWFSHPELNHGEPPLLRPLRWMVGDALAHDLCRARRPT